MRNDEPEEQPPADTTTPPAAEAPTETSPPESPPEPDAPAVKEAAAPTGSVSLETIRSGWLAMLDSQSTKIKARYRSGEVAGLDGDTVRFAVGSDMALKRCEDYSRQIEEAMSTTFGAPLKIAFSVEADGGQPQQRAATPPPSLPADESEVDIHDLTDAEVANASAAERIAEVFPGAEVMEQEN